MQKTRWAVLGPGRIAQDFVRALPNSRSGVLHAVGSSDPDRARAFADAYGAGRAALAGGYDDVLGRGDIDAVYVATVHPAHADLTIAALRAGHAVLCEKPLTPGLTETERVIAAARQSGRPLVEAFKNRFSPFARALDEIVASGEIGEPRRLEAAFGFAAPAREGRLFDPALAGGALLDVGCYPVSLAVAVAVAAGIDPRDLRLTAAEGTIGPTGVDEQATLTVGAGGFEAVVSTSIGENLTRSARLEGAAGAVEMPDAWGSRTASATELRVTRTADGRERVRTERVASVDPFAAEADALADALHTGRAETPEMPWSQSLAVARLLDEAAAALR